MSSLKSNEQEALDRSRLVREVLGHFATGVAVITATSTEGEPVGMSVNSFTSVSLEPPLVLFCAGRQSGTWKSIQASGQFCANILDITQQDLAGRFASRTADRFAGVEYKQGVTGSPVLAGASAFVDCRIVSELDGGDHVIVVGEVLDHGMSHDPTPLVFYRSRYSAVSGEGISTAAITQARLYVQQKVSELPSAATPIERLGTAVCAFVISLLAMSKEIRHALRNLWYARVDVRDELIAEEHAFFILWDELLAEVLTLGELRDRLPLDIARQLCMGTLGWVVNWWTPEYCTPEELASMAREFVLHGLISNLQQHGTAGDSLIGPV